MKFLERPNTFSSSSKFKVTRFEFESAPASTIVSMSWSTRFVVELDLASLFTDWIRLDFFRTRPWPTEQQPSTTRHLLFLANTQNSVGTDALHLLLNNESISETCQQLCYCREDNPSKSRSNVVFHPLGSHLESTTIYYFPLVFHIFVTMSKRTWSTENDIYKKFKWIPFKIDSVPWNGLLKRHLWRRMIDT